MADVPSTDPAVSLDAHARAVRAAWEDGAMRGSIVAMQMARPSSAHRSGVAFVPTMQTALGPYFDESRTYADLLSTATTAGLSAEDAKRIAQGDP